MSSNEDNTDSVKILPVTDDLLRIGVISFGFDEKSNNFILETVGPIIFFKVQTTGYVDTINNFDERARRSKVDNDTIQGIKKALMKHNDFKQFCNRFTTKEENTADTTINSEQQQQQQNQQEQILLTKEEENLTESKLNTRLINLGWKLDDISPGKGYLEFIIDIIKRRVKQEDRLVRLLIYVGLTAYTNNPLCIGIRAPTSEGKTYAVINTIKEVFPEVDVDVIARMSPQSLIHEYGVLVDSNDNPIQARIDDLDRRIRRCGRSEERADEKTRLQRQLEDLMQSSHVQIDLHGKIMIFLEPPATEVWNNLKPIISHDVWKTTFRFVNKEQHTTNVVIVGWPVCIFCSAKDESAWDIWPEIQSRFLIDSPNMTPEKYLDSIMLIGQISSLPEFIKDEIIVSTEETSLAKDLILYFKNKIKTLCPIRYIDRVFKPINATCIPYYRWLCMALPHIKGPGMRTAKHVFGLISIAALTKSQYQIDLGNIGEKQIIAREQDAIEILKMTQSSIESKYAGVPKNKTDVYKKTCMRVFYNKMKAIRSTNSNLSSIPYSQLIEYSDLISATRKDFADQYKKDYGKGINVENFAKQFLNELLINNVLGEMDDPNDKRIKRYFSLVGFDVSDIPEENKPNTQENGIYKEEKIHEIPEYDPFLYFSTTKILEYPKIYEEMPDDWLIFQILALVKRRMRKASETQFAADFINRSDHFKILEAVFDNETNTYNNVRLSINEFISKYVPKQGSKIQLILGCDSSNSDNKWKNYKWKSEHCEIKYIGKYKNDQYSGNSSNFPALNTDSNEENNTSITENYSHVSRSLLIRYNIKDGDSSNNNYEISNNNALTTTAVIEQSPQGQIYNNNPIITTSPQTNLFPFSDNYVTFDLEYNGSNKTIPLWKDGINGEADTIFAASFVDNKGNEERLHLSKFTDEKAFLITIVRKLLSYPMSMGWNSLGENSDLHLLSLRCEKHGVDFPIAKGDSAYNLKPNILSIQIKGHIHIDLMNVFDNPIIKTNIFKGAYKDKGLDPVAVKLLGFGKTENITGLNITEKTIDEQAEYNLQDSSLVMKLSKHQNSDALSVLNSIADITGLPFDVICHSTISTWWSAIFDKMNILPPYKPLTKLKYGGATVIEPKQGIHHDTREFDVKSLYPMQAVIHNISFDTVCCECCIDDLNAKVSQEVMDAINKKITEYNQEKDKDQPYRPLEIEPYWICNKRTGAYPLTLEGFIQQKFEYADKAKEIKKQIAYENDPVKKEELKQLALSYKSKATGVKILMNGGYGVFGTEAHTFNYANYKVAELITAYGRLTLGQMEKYFESKGSTVIYGDTDSIFCDNCTNEIAREAKEYFKNEFKFDTEEGDPFKCIIFFDKKKRYVGITTKNEIDLTGMDAKKSDRPAFVYNVFNSIIEKLFNNNGWENPNIVNVLMNDLKQISLSLDDLKKNNPKQFRIYKKVGREPSTYKSENNEMSKIIRLHEKTFGIKVEKDMSVWHYDTSTKEGCSLDPNDINIKKYRQSLWNTVKDILFQLINRDKHKLKMLEKEIVKDSDNKNMSNY